jgi:Cdc6-like AAA superfamily ATPase
LLDEWVLALESNPDKSSGEIRDLLSGRSEIDKFEYGYFATLQKMASMALGKEPMTRVVRSSSQIDKLQLITYGAPGTGKSHTIDKCTNESNSIRVTFHPDTDYAAFVGAYKPTMERTDKDLLSLQELQTVCRVLKIEVKRGLSKNWEQSFGGRLKN